MTAAERKPVKTAVVGATGYVGSHFWQAYRQLYPDAMGTSYSPDAAGLYPLDLRAPHLDTRALEDSGYEAVLIAAGKPNIGYCQQHPDDAYAVNVQGTLALVDQISRTSMKAIFLSSDYVFDGATGDYDDDAPQNPLTEYGKQKATVEKELPNRIGQWLVLRLSKVYGVERGDGTLLDEFANALTAGRPFKAATDQRFSPTLVSDLVSASLSVQSFGLSGIVNICADEKPSRYEVAIDVARALHADPSLIQPIRLHDLDGMVNRPLDTSMNSIRLRSEAEFDFTPMADSIRNVASNWERDSA